MLEGGVGEEWDGVGGLNTVSELIEAASWELVRTCRKEGLQGLDAY